MGYECGFVRVNKRINMTSEEVSDIIDSLDVEDPNLWYWCSNGQRLANFVLNSLGKAMDFNEICDQPISKEILEECLNKTSECLFDFLSSNSFTGRAANSIKFSDDGSENYVVTSCDGILLELDRDKLHLIDSEEDILVVENMDNYYTYYSYMDSLLKIIHTTDFSKQEIYFWVSY